MRRHRKPSSLALALLVPIVLSAVPSDPLWARPGGPCRLELLGVRVLEEDRVRRWAGRLPACDDRKPWAQKAVRRIVRKYRQRGYRYARGWYALDEGCSVRIQLDEGRMHRIVFGGAGAYRSLLLRVDLNLPKDVFHAPTLETALEELKVKHGLVHAYYRVREPGQTTINELGDPVKLRVLTVYTVTAERFGWSLDIDLDSTWGLVPKVGVTVPDLLFDEDRFHADVGLAVPYRKYLFDESPQAQWVHGEVGLRYRLPAFFDDHLAPAVSAGTSVSRYHRVDRGLERFYLLRTPASLRLVLLFPPYLKVTLGGGVEYTNVFLEELADDGAGPAETGELLRGTALLESELLLDREFLRQDQRDVIRLDGRFASAGGGDWMVRAVLGSELYFHFGRHDLILRARGVYVTGDVRFWDEESLAGDHQRVFFDNRYWVREAGQMVVAFRLAVWEDTVKIGVFHDGSLFADRSSGSPRFAAANAFGPSLHFLLFDLFALDTYYGFGFAPVGFDHNLSFSLKTVF